VLFILVFVSACQSDRVLPAATSEDDAEGSLADDADQPTVEEIEAELDDEVPLEDDMIDGIMEENVEEEIPEEEAPAASDILNFRMKEGDVVEYNGHSIKMIDILVGQTLELLADGEKVLVHSTGASELVGGDVRVTYVNAFDYNKDNAVNMRLEPFKLREDEYLLKKDESLEVDGYRLKLIDVRFDNKVGDGYIYIDTSEVVISTIRIPEGKTDKVGDATVTAVETFYQYKPYAILKIIV
ncbi:hypothetical protein HY501_00255, partial [Candidatus Woesearchaeota archaeon]|nr:hypothetical protein [Candidatus Woesearchaeota archaeon]